MTSQDAPDLWLNIGSGQRKFGKGWVNCDVNPKWEPDVVVDGVSMPMFDDNSATIICLHHVVEHFGLGEADRMIRECHRILAPGGSLLVFVPNLMELAKAYVKGDLTDYLYAVNLYGAYMDSEADRHKFGYSPTSLSVMLKQTAAWSAIKKFNWRQIPGSDLARDWWILALEATK